MLAFIKIHLLFSLSKSADAVFLMNLCVFSSISAIGFISYVFISRKYKTKLENKSEQIAEICQNFITELLFSEKLSPEALKTQEYLLENKLRKQLLLNEIIKLNSSLQGSEAEALQAFYISSEMVKMSAAKVHSSNKDLVLSGLTELVEMNTKTYLPKLKKLLDETIDTELKNYLLTAIVKLDPANGLQLILESNHFLSDWFQLVILKELDELKFTDFPPLSEWQTKNKTSVIFGERLYAFKKSLSTINDENVVISNESSAIEAKLNVEAEAIIVTKENIDIVLENIYKSESDQVKEEIRNNLSIFNSKTAFVEPKDDPQKSKNQQIELDNSVLLKIKNAFGPNKKITNLYLLLKNRVNPKGK
jgi:hypothetical protein